MQTCERRKERASAHNPKDFVSSSPKGEREISFVVLAWWEEEGPSLTRLV